MNVRDNRFQIDRWAWQYFGTDVGGGELAKGDIYIPYQVKHDIEQRLISRVEKTVAEFESAEEDEDVLTGHLGANLTTHGRQVWVSDAEFPGYWAWSLRYRKFRGRGPGATEKKLGADGIVELFVDRPGGSATKSMLFQAKMADSQGSRELVAQCARLSTWREAAAVFSYSAAGFEALALDEVLRARPIRA